MKLENQVNTATQSIRLKELGVIQESNYQWNLTTHAEPYLNVPPFGKVDNNGLSYAAFTVAELGVAFLGGQLGIPIHEGKINTKSEVFVSVSIETWITPNIFNCAIFNKEFPDRIYHECKSRYEAQARAAMLIYLLENNLTTAADVNERLKNA